MVFPSLLPHVDASPGRPRGGRTQLVDALAAAASAGLEDGMAERLAHSPPSRLHQLSQDSMLLRQGTGQEGSQDVGDAAAASEAQSSGANGMDSSRTPLLAGSAGSASSQEVGSQDHGSQGAAPGDFAADAAATRGAAAAGGLPAGSAEQALQLPQAGVSPRQQLRRLPLPSPFETQPSTLGRENGSQAFSAAEQPHAAPSGRPGEQAEVQKLRTAAPADSRDSLDGEQPRRARSAGVLPTLQSAQNGPTGGSASAQASPRSSDAGSLPRASSADGLPHGPGAAAAEATGPVQHQRAPSAVPFASLGDLVDVAMSSSPPPTGLPPRLPPRPPPPKPTAQHPMVVNIFRVRAPEVDRESGELGLAQQLVMAAAGGGCVRGGRSPCRLSGGCILLKALSGGGRHLLSWLTIIERPCWEATGACRPVSVLNNSNQMLPFWPPGMCSLESGWAQHLPTTNRRPASMSNKVSWFAIRALAGWTRAQQ